jgi:hypothetical protein
LTHKLAILSLSSVVCGQPYEGKTLLSVPKAQCPATQTNPQQKEKRKRWITPT